MDKELGFSLSTDKYFHNVTEEHFITQDHGGTFDFGESMKNVYALTRETEILEYSNGEVHLAANQYGKGRAVYIAGLPYSHKNTRLLLRSLYYAASKEEELYKWFAENTSVEVHAYPSIKKYAVLNNSDQKQNTVVHAGGKTFTVELEPEEIRWFEM